MPKAKISLTQIRQAVERFIYLFDGAQLVPQVEGDPVPITFIPEGHIYSNFVIANSRQNDEDYPKVSVSVDGGTFARGVAQQINERIGFDIIMIFKDIEHGDSPDSIVNVMAEKAIDDFRYLLEKNPRLFDTPGVESIDLGDWTTDSGAAFPEGIAYFKLIVTIRRG